MEVEVYREKPKAPDLFWLGFLEYNIFIIVHGIAVLSIIGWSPGMKKNCLISEIG